MTTVAHKNCLRGSFKRRPKPKGGLAYGHPSDSEYQNVSRVFSGKSLRSISLLQVLYCPDAIVLRESFIVYFMPKLLLAMVRNPDTLFTKNLCMYLLWVGRNPERGDGAFLSLEDGERETIADCLRMVHESSYEPEIRSRAAKALEAPFFSKIGKGLT